MKFDELRSIGHNVADSLASGVGFPIGIYGTDIVGEASRSPQGFITVDFLAGTWSGAEPSPDLRHAIVLYREAFAALCARHGTSPAAFREIAARYSMAADGRRVIVTIEGQLGHRARDEYTGIDTRRIRVVDELGRIRRQSTQSGGQ